MTYFRALFGSVALTIGIVSVHVAAKEAAPYYVDMWNSFSDSVTSKIIETPETSNGIKHHSDKCLQELQPGSH